MLGKKDYIAALGPKESSTIRETAFRIATHSLNEEEREMLAHFDKLSARNTARFVWK